MYDLEELNDVEIGRLLRWCAEELINRLGAGEGAYRIEDEVSEAMLITGARYAIEIVELDS